MCRPNDGNDRHDRQFEQRKVQYNSIKAFEAHQIAVAKGRHPVASFQTGPVMRQQSCQVHDE